MPCSANTSVSFVNAALTTSGVTAAVGHALSARTLTSGESSTSNIGKKMQSSGFRACLTRRRLSTCARATFDGKHGIDGAAAAAAAIQLGARVVRVDEVRGCDAEALEVRAEERRVRVEVQRARYADAKLRPAPHALRALARLAASSRATGSGSATFGGRRGFQTSRAAIFDQVRIGRLDPVELALDAAHVARRPAPRPSRTSAITNRRSRWHMRRGPRDVSLGPRPTDEHRRTSGGRCSCRSGTASPRCTSCGT